MQMKVPRGPRGTFTRWETFALTVGTLILAGIVWLLTRW